MSKPRKEDVEANAALNAALDAALDDFDDDDDDEATPPSSSSATAAASSVGPPPTPPPPMDDDTDDVDAVMMRQMMQVIMNGGGDVNTDASSSSTDRRQEQQPPELAMMGQFLQQMQTRLEHEVRHMEQPDTEKTASSSSKKKEDEEKDAEAKSGATTTTTPTVEGAASPASSTPNTSTTTPSPLDETIANLVESFAQNSMKDDEDDDDDIPPTGDNHHGSSPDEAAFLETLLQGHPDALLQGMMEELMSGEIMQEPIQQVAAAFPDWLEKHRETLSSEEWGRYVLRFPRFCRCHCVNCCVVCGGGGFAYCAFLVLFIVPFTVHAFYLLDTHSSSPVCFFALPHTRKHTDARHNRKPLRAWRRPTKIVARLGIW